MRSLCVDSSYIVHCTFPYIHLVVHKDKSFKLSIWMNRSAIMRLHQECRWLCFCFDRLEVRLCGVWCVCVLSWWYNEKNAFSNINPSTFMLMSSQWHRQQFQNFYLFMRYALKPFLLYYFCNGFQIIMYSNNTQLHWL